MKIGNWLRAFEWTTVIFGEGFLLRYVIFECKYLFCIYLNFWNTIAHDRFHTHAFPSISFFLRGWYYEEELYKGVRLYKAPMVRFIPRTNNHRMLQSSKDAITVTIGGPWDRMWSETFLDGTKRVLAWGRRVIHTNWPGDSK